MSEAESSAEKKKLKIDLLDLVLLLLLAIVFDLLSIIPALGSVIGPLGVVIFRVVFHFMGVNTKLMNVSPVIGFIIELIPIVEIIPSSILYVVVVYFETRYAEKIAARIPGGEKALNLAAAVGGDVKSMRQGAAGARQTVAAQAAATAHKKEKPSAGTQGFTATDQFGQTMGPQTAGGKSSESPYAQPGEQASTRPQGRQPSHPVNKARSEAGTARRERDASTGRPSEDESKQEDTGELARDPRLDQYGQPGPVSKGKSVAGAEDVGQQAKKSKSAGKILSMSEKLANAKKRRAA